MTAIKNRLFRLIPQRRSFRRLMFVFLLILLLALLGTISSCGKRATPAASPLSSNVECNAEDHGSASLIAHQPLALARYRILEQIHFQYDGWGIPGMSLTVRDDVLFPLGRSDKFYILSQGHNSTEEDDDVKLVCYKSQGKGVKLIYSVKLNEISKPPKEKIRVRNMLDYLGLLGYKGDSQGNPCSYDVPGNISSDTRRDLSLRQNLVAYSCDSNIGIYHIQCFSSKVAQSRDEHTQEFSNSDDDPNTKIDEADTWFEKYGFPVADCELVVKGGKKK